MTQTADLKALISPYTQRFDASLDEAIEDLGASSLLREAAAYALKGGGKRLRPFLVYATADVLGNDLNLDHVARCLEYLHIASLIADDLPCLDDDDVRRNRPACHKVYGETTALLASFSLIASSFEELARAGEEFAKTPFRDRIEAISPIALRLASQSLGMKGITGGVYYEMFPPAADFDTLLKVIHGKSTPLFAAALALGWLYGGGGLEQVDTLLNLGGHLTVIFQLCDDLDDRRTDQERGALINGYSILGAPKVIELIEQERRAIDHCIEQLGVDLPHVVAFADWLLNWMQQVRV